MYVSTCIFITCLTLDLPWKSVIVDFAETWCPLPGGGKCSCVRLIIHFREVIPTSMLAKPGKIRRLCPAVSSFFVLCKVVFLSPVYLCWESCNKAEIKVAALRPMSPLPPRQSPFQRGTDETKMFWETVHVIISPSFLKAHVAA